MTKTQIYNIVIKILGLSIFVTTFGHLVNFISYYAYDSFSQMAHEEGRMYFITGLFEYIILFPFSLVLIFRTRFVINLFHKPEEEEPSLQISLSDKSLIFEVAIVIIGLVSIMYTMPNLVVEIDKFIVNKSQYFTLHRSEFILTIMKLVMGFFAIVFSKDIGKKIGEK